MLGLKLNHVGKGGSESLSKLLLADCQWDHYQQLSVKLNQNTAIFIQQNIFENILCHILAILF